MNTPQPKTGSEMNRFFLWLFLNTIDTWFLHIATQRFFEVDYVERDTQSPKFQMFHFS
jgi:hypothetical protein